MWWISLVSAEKSTPVVDTVEIGELEQQMARIESLQIRVRKLEEEISMQSDFAQQDAEIISHLSVLVDSRQGEHLRIQAVQQLAYYKSPQVLPFLWEVMDAGADSALNRAVVTSLPDYLSDSPSEETILECRAIVQKALYVSEVHPSHVTLAIGDTDIFGALQGEMVIISSSVQHALGTLRNIQEPKMAELLLVYIGDEKVPVSLREEALGDLQKQYADWLVEQDIPVISAPVNKLANQIYAVSTGVTGSVLLGSVGVWGQNETSETIGYTGGALLGATSGWLIANQDHPTLAQSALMASSTGWGLATSQMVADGFNMNEEFSALSRTLGVMAGTGYGHWARDRNMSLSDVLEADFAGYIGAQTAVALTDIFADQSNLQYPVWEDYYPQEYEWDSAEAQGYDDAYNQAYRDHEKVYEVHQRRKLLMAAVGSTVGLGASHVLMDAWNPEPTSVLFAGVWAGQMGIAMSELLPATGVEYPQGWVRLSSHAAMVGSLYYDHRNPVSYEQSIFSAYGATAGYLLGYGANNLSQGEGEDGSRNAALLSTVATVGGTTIGNTMNFTASDWVTTGVGLGLTGWHMGSIATIAQDNRWLTSRQSQGLVQTGMGVASLGLLATGQYFDVSSADAIYLGSTAAWGAYYGALTPVALGVEAEMTDTERLLTTLIASDIFLAAGTYGILSNRVASEQSAIPQVLGLAGATMGSLGAFLFTDSSQVVSGAALLGATMGVGSGVLLKSKGKDFSMRVPQKKGQFTNLRLQTSPYMDEQGDMGFYVGVSN
jgi:hypothetical protein